MLKRTSDDDDDDDNSNRNSDDGIELVVMMTKSLAVMAIVMIHIFFAAPVSTSAQRTFFC